MKSAILGAAALLFLTAAARPAAEKPAKLVLAKDAGGWSDSVSADADHLLLDVLGMSPAKGRALIAWSLRSDDYTHLVSSDASIVDASGKTVVSQALGGLRVRDGDLSPDGKLAAIVASPYDDPQAKASLYVFDEKGQKIGKRAVEDEDQVLVGNSWIALWSAPVEIGEDDGADEDSAPLPQTVSPASFLKPDGTILRPKEPIGGALAKCGGGLAAVSISKLSLYRDDLSRKGEAALSFAVGFPVASDDGSLVSVADFTDTDDDRSVRLVELFDGSAKKTGEIRVKAILGVLAGVAPDGSAVAVTPAAIGSDAEATLTIEDAKSFDVVMTDRTGKERWRTPIDRRAPTDHVAWLRVAAGGKRVALGLTSQDSSVAPDQVLVLDEHGKEISRLSHVTKGLWLEPSGNAVWVADEKGISRRDVKAK